MSARAESLVLACQEAASRKYTEQCDRLAFENGMLVALVRTLCAEIHDLQFPVPGESVHGKATRLLAELTAFCESIEDGSDGMDTVLGSLEDATIALRDVTWGGEGRTEDERDFQAELARDCAPLLSERHEKANGRRFDGGSITGFGGLSA